MTHPRLRAGLTVAAAILITGCGGHDTVTTDPSQHTDTTAVMAAPLPTPAAAVWVATTPPKIYPEAGAGTPTTLTAKTIYGSPRVFLATGATAGTSKHGWVQVRTPDRPNAGLGWVPASAVTLTRMRHQVTVNLKTRKITVLKDGKSTASGGAAIGAPATPTPTGTYYITDRVTPPKGSVYGSYAAGLSAHSETKSVQTEFGRGDGQVAIHGWKDPSVFGKAVSHGCIRVPATVLDAVKALPLGTPVTIT